MRNTNSSSNSQFAAMEMGQNDGLPPQPAPFIGRAEEVESLLKLLRETGPRLLTITGPPGVGKTRLAIEVARRLSGTFEHGIHFLNLAPLQNADLVPLAIVQSLGLQGRRLKQSQTSSTSVQLIHYFRGKDVLLVLDNFEHVLSASGLISSLLTSCPHLKIVVTSREPVRISWESEYNVAAFPVPSLPTNTGTDLLKKEPAIALFVDRAQAISPGFTLTPANIASLVEICRRLDGLPLAIELAAGRIKTLSPQEMASHLAHRFDVLISRRVDTHERHRSLHGAILWSYQLLRQREQAILRALSVFRSGFTLNGANAVIQTENEAELLDTISSLLEKNLLIAIRGIRETTRYGFLESIREFASKELAAAGEVNRAQTAHAAYFLALTNDADTACNGPDQALWMNEVAEEIDNFRAALQWYLEHEPLKALRLAIGLHWFWAERGYFIESYRWVTACLTKAPNAPKILKARALASHGVSLAILEVEESVRVSLQGLELAREAGDPLAQGLCLSVLGVVATIQGNYSQAESYYAERLSLHEQHGPAWGVANTLSQMAALARMEGDLKRASDLATRNLEISRRISDKANIALALGTLGWIALHQGELNRSTELFEEALAINQELGAVPRIARNLRGLGVSAFRGGDPQLARRLAVESIRLSARIAAQADFLETIRSLCISLVAGSDPRTAARWLGFVQAEMAEAGLIVAFGVDREAVNRLVHKLRARLGNEAFEEALNRGRHSSIEQVTKEVETVLTEECDEEVRPSLLSSREREVAVLVSEGLSNAAIAERLHIGVRTAETHIQSIMNKLDFHSRTQIAAWIAGQKRESDSTS